VTRVLKTLCFAIKRVKQCSSTLDGVLTGSEKCFVEWWCERVGSCECASKFETELCGEIFGQRLVVILLVVRDIHDRFMVCVLYLFKLGSGSCRLRSPQDCIFDFRCCSKGGRSRYVHIGNTLAKLSKCCS